MSERVFEPARNVVSTLAALILLFGMVATFVLPVTASEGIVRGAHGFNNNAGITDRITIDPPAVTEADVDAGAILIAQLVATAEAGVNNIWICPLESGWTQVERVGEISNVVQHLWWRHVTAPQTEFASYTFVSRLGGCHVQSGEAASITGAITLYTGIDTADPIGIAVSTASSVRQTGGTAPATISSHPAGSRTVRYFGTDLAREIRPADSSRIYSVDAVDRSRTAAAFDTMLDAAGPANSFSATWSSRTAAWVATTVVLEAPSTPSEPVDTTPPQTMATSTPYTPGSWSNAPVSVTLNTVDTGGSGVKEILYSATGAQATDQQTVPAAAATVSIATEGITTIAYAARDHAGNLEPEQTFVVKIDLTQPSLSGIPTTSPNASGWFNRSVTVDWSCSDGLSGTDSDCPVDSVIGLEGANLSASATVRDKAGNQTVSSLIGINIDWTPPVTRVGTVPGWSDGPVTVSLVPGDNLSGVLATYYRLDQQPQQSGTEVTLSQSGIYTLTYWSVDVAGNEETPTPVDIKIDTIAPSINHTLSSDPNAYGWHNTPVTMTFVCDDGTSGIASCTEPRTLETDGANQSVTGTAIDNAGNSAIDSAIVNIDQVPPEISVSQTPTANSSGWHNASVTVTFDCTDATSGINDCPLPETVGEGINQNVTGVATDLAGNAASATVPGINVDLTPPEIRATATTEDGTEYVPGTWVNQLVTVTFECSDALSGITSCPDLHILSEGAGQSVAGMTNDIAGNSASATIGPFNVDLTAPMISASLMTADGQPYISGTWARQAVTVEFSCRDELSTIASCSAPQTLRDGADQVVIGTVTDAAGNTSTVTVDNINVDTTGPSITVTATMADGGPYVSGTWTNQTVTVSFTCSDDGSGLAGPCPLPVVVGASTTVAGQIVSAQISDLAGQTTTSTSIVVMVDKEAPAFTFVPGDQIVEATSDAGAVVLWSVPVAHDAIAGAITPQCSAASGSMFPLGDTTVTCTAIDPSGNVASDDFTVTVRDTQPELTVPESMTVPADSPAGAIVTYDIPTSESRVASQLSCTPPSGSHFSIGTTTVWCSATDGMGNTATASFHITVIGAADLLVTLRTDTVSLVTNRNLERALLRSLDRAQESLKTGNTLRAYASLLQYRVQVGWYARLGRLSPAVSEQLQIGARQVTNALF